MAASMDGSTLLGRCARWVGIGRNPLRRRTDRIEAWLTVVWTIAVAACGPFVVWRCGEAAHDRTVAAADWQRHRLFPVHAVLLEDTNHLVRVYGEDGHTQWTVQARWTAPDGTPHEGPVDPPVQAKAGTTVLIWTDVYGNPGKRSAANPMGSAIGVGIASAFLVVAVHAGVLLTLRALLNRRRMAAWQRQWRDVEPRWSGRR